MVIVIFISFVISRIIGIYFWPKQPFNFGALNVYMQYLDPELLHHDLFRSLMHLHSQPPLFNLFLGIMIKTVPQGILPATFQMAYFGLGFAVCILLYALMLRFGVNKRTAIIVTISSMYWPSLFKYERELSYALPLAFLLLASVFFLQKFAERGNSLSLFLFLLSMITIVLSRSFFHLVLWMTPVCLALFLWRFIRFGDHNVSLILAVAILVASLPYSLNFYRYGLFTSSTWQGMNLSGTTSFFSVEHVFEMINRGDVTKLALVPRFSPPEIYLDYYGCGSETGVPALDQTRKSTGSVNYNHAIYPKAASEYWRNSLRLIWSEPLTYMKAVGHSAYNFFGIQPYSFLFDYSNFLPRLTLKGRIKSTILNVLIPLGTMVAFLTALTTFLRGIREAGKKIPPMTGKIVCHLYIVWTLIYVFVLATTAEFGEACVMRVPIDPLILAGLAIFFDNFATKKSTTSSQRLKRNVKI